MIANPQNLLLHGATCLCVSTPVSWDDDPLADFSVRAPMPRLQYVYMYVCALGAGARMEHVSAV